MSKHLVAVYGSLRKGLGNHSILGDSDLLSVEVIKGFDMYSLGAFPAVETGKGEITVEVYEVDDDTLFNLDILEGVPTFYQRDKTETSLGVANIYTIEGIGSDRIEKVVNGDWVEYLGS